MPVAAHKAQPLIGRSADREGADGRPGSQETCLRPQAHKALVERGWLMLTSRRTFVALVTIILAALLPLASVISSASAAGSPATVTVRIQGLGGETLLQQTPVTTNTTPIAIEGGGTCEGTSAGGAIYDATGGNWKVKNQSEGIELQGLEGLDLPEFNSKEPSGIYWALWLEGKYAESGMCSQSIASGRSVRCAKAQPRPTTS